MATSEPFTLVTEAVNGGPNLFDRYHGCLSGKTADPDVQLVTELRAQYPELTVTTVPAGNINLLQFAAAGYAKAELDTADEPVIRWRGYVPAVGREGTAELGEARFFAKYRYQWNDEDFVLYVVQVGYSSLQYVLKEPRGDETTLSNSAVVDALLYTVGQWATADEDIIYVYDNYWSASKDLWRQVDKASWDSVILDPKMKKELAQVSGRFFDSKDVYEEYGVPWKRGLIFHGPVGNGKTISIKALMHALYQRKPKIPSLYVKSAQYTFNIRDVFVFARTMAPCLLILEDIETIVTQVTRSYFFNEVDGLENNDGILMIATTNYLDRLDPGLSKRPSRFDRKYLFPLPDLGERTLYAEYWQRKLRNKERIEFPRSLCRPIARLTGDFSFAYMQEAFVATLLALARGDASEATEASRTRKDPGHGEDDSDSGEDDDPEQYEFFRVIRETIKILRRDMDSSTTARDADVSTWDCGGHTGRVAEAVPLPPVPPPPPPPPLVHHSHVGAAPPPPVLCGARNAPRLEELAARMKGGGRVDVFPSASSSDITANASGAVGIGSTGTARLTAATAMGSLRKVGKLNDGVWQFGPPNV